MLVVMERVVDQRGSAQIPSNCLAGRRAGTHLQSDRNLVLRLGQNQMFADRLREAVAAAVAQLRGNETVELGCLQGMLVRFQGATTQGLGTTMLLARTKRIAKAAKVAARIPKKSMQKQAVTLSTRMAHRARVLTLT
jgi:hypothetical protein